MRTWPGQFIGFSRYSASSSFHGRIHVVGVNGFMAGDAPKLATHDVRGIDHAVAAPEALFPHPVFHRFADKAALRVPEDQAGARNLLDAEEIELLAEYAVVARLDLLEVLEVGFEILLREEGRAVNALELLVVFFAQPVRPRRCSSP